MRNEVLWVKALERYNFHTDPYWLQQTGAPIRGCSCAPCSEYFRLEEEQNEVASKLPEPRMDEPSSGETRTLPYEDWMVIEGALCRVQDETLSTSELKLVTETLSRLREAKP